MESFLCSQVSHVIGMDYQQQDQTSCEMIPQVQGWLDEDKKHLESSQYILQFTLVRCVAKDNVPHTFHTWGDSSISFKVNCRHKNLPVVIL